MPKICPKCNKEWPDDFIACPHDGTTLIEKTQKPSSISLNLGDANAISGGVNMSDNRSINNNTVNTTTNTVDSHNVITNNITHVEREKTQEELWHERELAFREACIEAYSSGILTSENKRKLDDLQFRLGLDGSSVSRILSDVSKLTARKSSSLSPVHQITFDHIKTAINNNRLDMIKRLMPQMKAMVLRYTNEEIEYSYYMLQAVMHPKECIAEYENHHVDNYWQTFWTSIAYRQEKYIEKSVLLIFDLTDKWGDTYPQDNESVLAAANAILDNDLDTAKSHFDLLIGDHSPLLSDLIFCMYSLINAGLQGNENLNEKPKAMQFYSESLFTDYCAQIKERIRQEEEQRREEERIRLEKERIRQEEERRREEERIRLEKERIRHEEERRREEERIRLEKERIRHEEEQRREEERIRLEKERIRHEEERRREEERIRLEKERIRQEKEAARIAEKQKEDYINFGQQALDRGDYASSYDYFLKAGANDKIAAIYQRGLDSYTNKEFKNAFSIFLLFAQRGDIEAMRSLGDCYANGNGILQNHEQAFSWYEKAAEGGNVEAMASLGLCYGKGLGVSQNLHQAFMWFKQAAEGENVKAMYNLGICYEYGKGVSKNLKQAFSWYDKAAKDGLIEAMSILGVCYQNGNGVSKNMQKAFSWFKKAAEGGNVAAMNDLGICYYNGEGVSQNSQQAFSWFKKAVNGGNVNAIVNLGHCYKYGEGTWKDENQAYLLYQKAAQKGDGDAMYELAMCCKRNIGNSKDYDKWLQMAIDKGVPEAIEQHQKDLKEIRIQPNGKILKVWMSQVDRSTIALHMHLQINNLKGKECEINIYSYDLLKNCILTQCISPLYDNCEWKDYVCHLRYSQEFPLEGPNVISNITINYDGTCICKSTIAYMVEYKSHRFTSDEFTLLKVFNN